MTEFRHASGEGDYGACAACSEDDDAQIPCYDAEPDPEATELCRWCGHTVEDVP